MKWRYGVVRYKNKDNPEHVFYAVGELYYKDDPLKPFACTEEPVETYVDHDDWVEDNDPIRDITDQLKRMLKDCGKYPIFDAEGPFEKYPKDD
jgi:hypothetical protein